MNINFTLIGQMGTFLVLWWFVHKFVWPLFTQAIQERQQKIAEGLSMADQARFSMQAAEEQSAELISQAKNQASDILSRAQKQAEQMVAEARNEALQAGQREIESAREEIEQEKNKAREVLKQQLAALVVQGATQVVGREIKSSDHERLLRELSEKL